MGIWNREYMGGSSRRGFGGGAGGGFSAIQVIIGLNVAVFLLWMLGGGERGGSELARFMNANFVVSLEAVKAGRVWTLVTAAFSHEAGMHLLLNMFVFWSFGSTIEARLGRRNLWFIYLGAALVASLAHVLVNVVTDRNSTGLGASGSVAAILVMVAIANPRSMIMLMGVIPIPAWLLVGGGVFVDIVGLSKSLEGRSTGIGHAAHLGGALAGSVAYYIFNKMPRLPRMPRRAPSPPKVQSMYGSRPSAPPPPPQSAVSQFTAKEQEELDRILAKISREGGVDQLPEEEREFLQRLSERYRRDD